MVVFISAHPDGRTRLLEVLRADADAASAEPGNGRFELYEHLDDPLRFTLIEEWMSQEALDEHMTHDHTAAVVAALHDPRVTASIEPWRIPEEAAGTIA
jgi:quinol monooxygenase YgiN